MEHNINQAQEFVRLLTGNSDTPVTWQIFYDVDKSRPDLGKTFKSTLTEALPTIKWHQERHCGVYVGINEFEGDKRSNASVTAYRGLFADVDGAAEPVWSLTPHFIQKRDATHTHAFWLVSDITSNEQFSALQKRISLHHGTDPRVCDPARVFRVAGFNHYKNPNAPAQYTVTDDNTDGEHKYTVAEIEAAFPLTAQQDAELNAWIEKKDSSQTGTGYEENEFYINKTSQWLATVAPPAIQGSGNATVHGVASYGHDHGVPLDTMRELMWELYNPRCVPPWEPHERYDFEAPIESAYTHAQSAAGCKTTLAQYAAYRAENPLPEPVGGWEGDASRAPNIPKTTSVEVAVQNIRTAVPVSLDEDNEPMGNRIAHRQGAVLVINLNEKSSHYELALAFDGVTYHGRNLLRCDKIFYVFNGKTWQEIGDDVIKAEVQNFYREYAPNDTFTRGVYNCLCDLVNHMDVQNGTWLNGCNIDPNRLIVFKNGILNLDDPTKTIMPHTSNLFVFNCLSYDYTPDAKCDVFIRFLHEVFNGDTVLIQQLREWIGYCMTTDISYQKMALFLGKSRAGKGVLTGLIRKLVGEKNTVAPSLGKFTKDSALHAMSQASLILVPDAHTVNFANRADVLVNLKAITGCDPMDYHVMYKGTQTSIFLGKIMMSSNNMPDFQDESGALANRLLVFPFEVSFKGREDITLKARIEAESEGICQWALEGLEQLSTQGKFTEANAGLQEKEDIRDDMFPLAAFVRSSCDIQEHAMSTITELFAAYKLWCSLTGVMKPMTEIQLGKTLNNSELPIVKTRPIIEGIKVRGFKGIRVSSAITGKMTANVVNFKPITPAENAAE